MPVPSTVLEPTVADGVNSSPSKHTCTYQRQSDVVGKTHIIVSGKSGLNLSSTNSSVTLDTFLNLSMLYEFPLPHSGIIPASLGC